MSTTGSKLFQIENLHLMPDMYPLRFSPAEIKRMDPARDRLLLTCIAGRGYGTRQRVARERLGLTDAPELPADVSGEKYDIFREQIVQMEDMASFYLLRDASFDSRCAAPAFAFCRLTGTGIDTSAGPYSGMSFSCGLLPCMPEEDICTFSREMIERQGPFAQECETLLRAGKAKGD